MLPCESLGGQHCPAQQMSLAGQHVLVLGPDAFSQLVGVCPEGQGAHWPVPGLVQLCPVGQHTLPHTWLSGQHAPPMHWSLRAQHTPAQQALNPGQQTPPQTWPGGKQHAPVLSQAPPRQQTPLQTGSFGVQQVTPSLHTSSVAQQIWWQDTGGAAFDWGQQIPSVDTLSWGQHVPSPRHTSFASQHSWL